MYQQTILILRVIVYFLIKISLITWLGLIVLTLGLAGLINGPIPYLPIPGLREFHESVASELFSMGLAVLLIDTANERRADRKLKEEIILQMGSPDNGFALEAIRILRRKGWLGDGSLKNTEIPYANLKDARLSLADLRGVNLVAANLHGAILERANLQSAVLNKVNLQGANLMGANLHNAVLSGTHLEGANLVGANLHSATLWEAKLWHNPHPEWPDGTNEFHVFLRQILVRDTASGDTVFDDTTRLPDGTFWRPDTDMTRFTDPEHPNFWRPDVRYSPSTRQTG